MKILKDFIKLESSAGLALILATIIALIATNTPLQNYYNNILHTMVTVSFGELRFSKPFIIWVNDGLMAIFFMLIGLELKREFVVGHLKDKANITLPFIGAVGGLLIPALIFYYFNKSDEVALRGWAIPTATDIAFALGVLSLLSDKIPKPVKIFLLTLAIFDDLAAIIIIAIFYTNDISIYSLFMSVCTILLLTILNKLKIKSIAVYVLVGLFLWASVLKSGVHATLAGVIIALFIPIDAKNHETSPLHVLEQNLHPWVAFLILPTFAFVNMGLDLKALFTNSVFNPITIGIAVGLFIGKQLGVFSFCFTAIKIFKIKLPENFNFLALYGVSILTGIGFTMSLFIASLSYEEISNELIIASRFGILVGSLLSSIIGYSVMRVAYK